MGTLLMRQASSYLQEKYRAARLAFTDVSEAELWAEQVTDNNPWSPDTKTMTQIAEASYYFDDYWRIVDVLHKRFSSVDWKRWRQYYNTLILFEFLITHGPEDIVEEFKRDIEVIKELGTFRHIDHEGVKWGTYMRSKSERILKLMQGGPALKEVRSKAIKLTNEIHGFGNSPSSSSSSSSPPGSWTSSFDSNSSSSPTWGDMHENDKLTERKRLSVEQEPLRSPCKEVSKYVVPKNFLDDDATITTHDGILDLSSIDETFTEIDLNDDEDEKKVGFFQGIYSKHVGGYSPLKSVSEKLITRSLSDTGKEEKKKLQHSYSSLV